MLVTILTFVLLHGATAGVVAAGLKNRHGQLFPPNGDEAAAELAGQVMAGHQSPHLAVSISFTEQTTPSEADADADAAGLAMAGCLSLHLVSSYVEQQPAPSEADEEAELGGLSLAGCTSPHLGEAVAHAAHYDAQHRQQSPLAALVATLRKAQAPVIELVARRAPATRLAVQSSRSFKSL